jgi:carbonic anhydrase
VILQLERLLDYPLVRKAVERRRLFLHGWHYLIEDGRVLVLNVAKRRFEVVERHESGSGSVAPG